MESKVLRLQARHIDELAATHGKKIGFAGLVDIVAKQYQEMLALAAELEKTGEKVLEGGKDG